MKLRRKYKRIVKSERGALYLMCHLISFKIDEVARAADANLPKAQQPACGHGL